jgi:uncharacterized protein (TIGR02001 family)
MFGDPGLAIDGSEDFIMATANPFTARKTRLMGERTMPKSHRKSVTAKFTAVFGASCLFIASPAQAADEPAADAEASEASGPFDIEVTLDAVSDYRFRGISLSDKDPAFQPSITISHESGFYVSAWGSNVADNGGDDIELDLVAGFAYDIGNVTLDVNATYYVYPGVSSFNYVELIGRASAPVGKGEVGLTFAYVPSQNNTGNQDNTYVAIDGSMPLGDTPLSLNGSFGFENGAFGDNKKDWSLGVSAELGKLTLGVAYVDTAHAQDFGNIADAGVVVSASLTF